MRSAASASVRVSAMASSERKWRNSSIKTPRYESDSCECENISLDSSLGHADTAGQLVKEGAAMARTHLLGFPRIGAQRELKFALESFWRGESEAPTLQAMARALRERHWALQRDAGLTHIVAGDFSLYDGMLDLSVLLGALPARFGFDARALTPAQYFELARGNAAQPAMEMTKWFDTNYHYLVPELAPDTRFDGGRDDWFEQIREAQATGAKVKPVLIGPVTYLRLAKTHVAGFDRLSLLP